MDLFERDNLGQAVGGYSGDIALALSPPRVDSAFALDTDSLVIPTSAAYAGPVGRKWSRPLTSRSPAFWWSPPLLLR